MTTVAARRGRRRGKPVAVAAGPAENAPVTETAGRTVRVLVTCRGERLGEVGPFPVESARWPEVEEVTARLERAFGVPVMVLRLLSVEGGEGASGGLVTYHAEALSRPARHPAPPSTESSAGRRPGGGCPRTRCGPTGPPRTGCARRWTGPAGRWPTAAARLPARWRR